MTDTVPKTPPRPVLPRPAARTAAGAAHQAALATRLTPRDRWLARMLHEHRVLTSDQITQLAWPTRRAANHRLLELYRWRVLDRFQPLVPAGSAPAHYVLDVAGATALAHEDGLDPDKTGYRHDRAVGVAHSRLRDHTVAVNGLFTSLVARARTHPGSTLTAWWPENRCERAFGDLARPDAYGRWQQDGHDVDFYLELDRGTEPLPLVGRKLATYHDLAAATGFHAPVLFWLPTARRETGVRNALAAALHHLDRPEQVPVATTAGDLGPPGSGTDPALARWLPLAPTRTAPGRLRLADLARAWPRPARTGTGASRPADPPTRPGQLLPPAPMPPTPPAQRTGRW